MNLDPWQSSWPNMICLVSMFVLSTSLFTSHDFRIEREGSDLLINVTAPEEPGTYPLLVFSHGRGGDETNYQPLVEGWVEQGYVVVRPRHADAGRERSDPTRFRNWSERPGEVSLILDEVESWSTVLEDGVKVDMERIGVSGHSFGAHTAQLVAGTRTKEQGQYKSYRDERVDATILISGQGTGDLLDEGSWDSLKIPTMVVTGSLDFGRNLQSIDWRIEPFERAASQEKYLLFIEGADHGFGGLTGEDGPMGVENPKHLEWVLESTLAFWKATLHDDAEAREFLLSDELESRTDGIAKITPGAAGKRNQNKASAQEIQVVEWTWTDEDRDREIPARAYLPSGGGKHPVVLMSHGGGESNDSFGYLGRGLAEAGYVMVALTHHGSDSEAYRSAMDSGSALQRLGDFVSNFMPRPGDISLAINSLSSEDPGHSALIGRLDPDRLAIVGQCIGTSTALIAGGMTVDTPEGRAMSYREEAVDAVVALGPNLPNPRNQQYGAHAESWSSMKVPQLFVVGGNDFGWLPEVRQDPQYRQLPYDESQGAPKHLIWIDDAGHHAFTDSDPFYPAGPRNPKHHDWILEGVTTFLDAYLRDDGEAYDALVNHDLAARDEKRADPGGDR
ncbi:MAG: alpha/beta hydrolase family protein, partial [Fimbriimonadaceae bacterium]